MYESKYWKDKDKHNRSSPCHSYRIQTLLSPWMEGSQGHWVLGGRGRREFCSAREGGWSHWFKPTVQFWCCHCLGFVLVHKNEFALEPMLLLRRNHTEPSCGSKKMCRFQPESLIGFYMTLAGVNRSACYYTLNSSHMVGQHFKVVSKCWQQSILVPLTHLPQVINLTTW